MMENENVAATGARWARKLGRAWHQPQVRQTPCHESPGADCEWQPWVARMQQAWWTGATAAANAVAIGQQRASTTSTAVARANWRGTPGINS